MVKPTAMLGAISRGSPIFLEIGSDCNGKIKENMIQNEKRCHHPFGRGQGIGINMRTRLKYSRDKTLRSPKRIMLFPIKRAQIIVDDIIDHKKDGHFLN